MCIAGISIQIDTDVIVQRGKAFDGFMKQLEYAGYNVVFEKSSKLNDIPETCIYESRCYRVHPDGKGGYLRSFFDAPKDMTPYALATYDYEKKQICIDYLEKGEHCVSEMSNSFFHIGLEALMIREQRLCFHAACVKTHLGGILFSGPSGVGKSTQADLWRDYKNAKLINGDRPILSKAENGFLAWGSPYAGSSKCYVNERCPVSAIMMLRQSERCRLHKLNVKEAFTQIYKGLTIYSWDRKFVELATDLAIELAKSVPVYEFECTPDKFAVEYLEKELQKDWNYE